MSRFDPTPEEQALLGPEKFGPFRCNCNNPRYSKEGYRRFDDYWEKQPWTIWDELELYRRMSGVVAIVHPPRRGSPP